MMTEDVDAGRGAANASQGDADAGQDATDELIAGLRQLGADLAFNRHLGVEVDHLEVGSCRTRLPHDARLTNHVGNVHAIAELAPVELAGALAVASRLSVLLERGLVPVVRSLEVRYLAPAPGMLVASAEVGAEVVDAALAALDDGHRPRAPVHVEVHDQEGTSVAVAHVVFVFVPPAG